MAQISKYPISSSVYERILDIFLKTLVEIGTRDEAKQFTKDFLTPTEQIMLAKRLSIAFLLEKGYDYRTISRVLRVSAPTIASVNLMRQYGSLGYKKMINKLLREEKIKEFLLKVGESLTATAGKSSKGGGTWRYLHQELKKKRKIKAF
jgi:uncharacterized protein YerC